MPQLPSGRYVALQATPLFKLIEDAYREDAIITRLLRIERVEHLFPYVDVLYFLDVDGVHGDASAPGSNPLPHGLQQYPSGFTLATIAEEMKRWQASDRSAFEDMLGEDRTRSYLEALLANVAAIRKDLFAHAPFLPALQSGLWQTKVHPLQTGETDDPMFDAFEDPYDPNANR